MDPKQIADSLTEAQRVPNLPWSLTLAVAAIGFAVDGQSGVLVACGSGCVAELYFRRILKGH